MLVCLFLNLKKWHKVNQMLYSYRTVKLWNLGSLLYSKEWTLARCLSPVELTVALGSRLQGAGSMKNDPISSYQGWTGSNLQRYSTNTLCCVVVYFSNPSNIWVDFILLIQTCQFTTHSIRDFFIYLFLNYRNYFNSEYWTVFHVHYLIN